MLTRSRRQRMLSTCFEIPRLKNVIDPSLHTPTHTHKSRVNWLLPTYGPLNWSWAGFNSVFSLILPEHWSSPKLNSCYFWRTFALIIDRFLQSSFIFISTFCFVINLRPGEGEMPCENQHTYYTHLSRFCEIWVFFSLRKKGFPKILWWF